MKQENIVKDKSTTMPYESLSDLIKSAGYRIKYKIGQIVYLRTDADQLGS